MSTKGAGFLLVLLVAGAVVAIIWRPALNDRAQRLEVRDVLSAPQDLDRVIVAGTAFPAGDGAFVLTQGERSIWVIGSREEVARVRALELVTVVGTVERLTAQRAVELADRVAETDPAQRPGGQAVLRARRTQGDPYIELDELSRAAAATRSG